MDLNDKYIGQLLDDRYEIQKLIGEGGMSVVYRALDHRLSRMVAVKIMREEMAGVEEFREVFNTESHAVAMLSHPNIVTVYDVSHSEDIEYIVMELVNGITLRQYMDRKGALSWQEMLHFSKQIAAALSHAHSHGIIHRDIKPQNVMLLRDGTVKVGDFGVAAVDAVAFEGDGEAVGSIHYVAPEQARGASPDARSDIYSLGVTMYEMLTARKPYDGDTIGQITIQHMNNDLTPIDDLASGVPEELQNIVYTAMADDLEARYQSADDLIDDFDAFTRSRTKKPEPEPEPEPEYQNPDVVPIRSVTELSKEKYRMRRRRASRVSFLTGVFGALVTCILLFVFLWNFWMKEIFSPAQRIELPSFVGYNIEAVMNNSQYSSIFNFEVTYVVDTETQSGLILSQEPAAGSSRMMSSDGITVELRVSTGLVYGTVPDVVNRDYREARTVLGDAGYKVDVRNAVSEYVEKDCVISMSPEPNEQLAIGSVVYLTVSTGPEIDYVEVPNLVGHSETEAISLIEGAHLSYAQSEYYYSNEPADTVIGQNIEPGTSAEEHTKIIIRVSAGPQG